MLGVINMKKIKSFLYHSIDKFFIFFYLIILLIVFFCTPDVIKGMEFTVHNLWLVIISLLLLTTFICFFRKKKFSFPTRTVILTFSIFLFYFHLILIFNILFKSGWDAGVVMDSAYNNIFFKTNDMNYFNINYFSAYPNNVALLFYEMIICFIVKVFSGDYFTFNLILVLINSLIFIITGILLYLILNKKLKNNKLAILGLLIYTILIGTSPWVLIPYTDSISLIFVISIVYIYMFSKKKNLIKFSLISLLSFIGFKLKPQVFIIFIAITIFELINLFIAKKFKLIVKYIGIITVSGLIVMLPMSLITDNMKLDNDKKFGVTHFIMMGLNYERSGLYSQDDVDFSYSWPNQNIRKQKNLEVIKNRISDYGGTKLLKHLKNKVLINYNDGTFAFGIEGTFYNYEYESKLKSSNFLKQLFHTDGIYYNTVSFIRHGVWLLVLLFLILGNKNENKDKQYILVMKLALLGLLLYLLLFEARARYLFIYVPIFIIIAINNLDYILETIKKKVR